jgi:hypothetical protein
VTKPAWGMSGNDLPHEEFTEFRLTWTYPYLKNRDEHYYAFGRTVDSTRAQAMRDEAYMWAGEELAWHKRHVRIERGEWEEFE